MADYDRWLETNPYEEYEEATRRAERQWDAEADKADLEYGDDRLGD